MPSAEAVVPLTYPILKRTSPFPYTDVALLCTGPRGLIEVWSSAIVTRCNDRSVYVVRFVAKKYPWYPDVESRTARSYENLTGAFTATSAMAHAVHVTRR